MKLRDLFGEVDRWVEQKLSSEERDNSEAYIKLGDFLSMLNKMYELMNMAEKTVSATIPMRKKSLRQCRS